MCLCSYWSKRVFVAQVVTTFQERGNGLYYFVDLVASAAIRARCHYVNKKWLGVMSTNWSTTETRLDKFMDLRAEHKKEDSTTFRNEMQQC
ncbi:hypothetical protein MKW92_040566 [Papaver armeniacum]|nr:hypothetical protein MKW92_040566 [Papaver armeniacum]